MIENGIEDIDRISELEKYDNKNLVFIDVQSLHK